MAMASNGAINISGCSWIDLIPRPDVCTVRMLAHFERQIGAEQTGAILNLIYNERLQKHTKQLVLISIDTSLT